MKFLIINTPNGEGARWNSSSDRMRRHSQRIQEALESGFVEKAWILNAGGHAFVANAGSCEELHDKLRSDPLREYSRAQIIPVMDALDFIKALG